jgi:hypothetical protein
LEREVKNMAPYLEIIRLGRNKIPTDRGRIFMPMRTSIILMKLVVEQKRI